MSISLNALFYGDETSMALEKGCSFCKKKHQCQLAYTTFSKKCEMFDYTQITGLIPDPKKKEYK